MQKKTLILSILVLFLLIPVVQAEDAVEWTTRGLAALDAGKNSDALTYFNNAIAQDKNYATALSGKATALNALGDYKGALDAADKSLALRTQDERALNARALALFNLKRYNESAIAYNTLFTMYQVNLPEGYCNQGYAYLMQNKSTPAVASYLRCTSLDPENFFMWNNLGLSYMRTGDYDHALSAFDSATSITVKNATVWNNKGTALVAQGKTSDALQCFYKALAIDPGYADALKNKEEMNGKLQSFYLLITPTTTPTLNRLGTYYTTATPAPQVTTVETTVAPQGEENLPVTTEPVAKKTTYSPLSPFAVFGALAVVGGLVLLPGRK